MKRGKIAFIIIVILAIILIQPHNRAAIYDWFTHQSIAEQLGFK